MLRKVSKDFMAGWLRGFFDGEGSVSFRKESSGRKHTAYYLTVTNTDALLMDTCQEYLAMLGIEFSEWSIRRRRNRKPCRTLHICRADSIRIYAEKVGFMAPEKAARLKQIMEWINRPTVGEKLLPRIQELYRAGHSLRCIGKQLGYKPGFHGRFRTLLIASGVEISRTRNHCCRV